MIPVIAAQLSFTFFSVESDFLRYGMWMYLMVFFIVILGSTVVGGLIPNNTFLFLSSAVARVSGFSIAWLFLVAAMGGFAGYEIDYWHGRLFGNTILRGGFQKALQQRYVRRVFDMMKDFGPATLIASRLMPVLNLPAFLAGADRTDHRRFVVFNLISSAVWGLGILVVGYFFGGIPIIHEYLGYFLDFLIAIIIITTIIALIIFAHRYMKRNADIQNT